MGDPKLNPFSIDPPSQRPETRSIPEMLTIFSKFNLKKVLGPKSLIKVNNLYRILTSELGITVTVADLKELAKYLHNKQSGDENFEFMDKDESLVDLDFLQSLMPASREQTRQSP